MKSVEVPARPSSKVSERPSTTAEAKKYKSALDTMADEYIPIRSELPLDPVMAEDGRVYERKRN